MFVPYNGGHEIQRRGEANLKTEAVETQVRLYVVRNNITLYALFFFFTR